MRDPLTWSVPLGRIFGITLRVHVLFPVVALGLILHLGLEKDAVAGNWLIMAGLQGLLFVSVLLHEFGHCFGARYADGDAQEILLWPLGGLAFPDVPHTARANAITTAAGPAVNLLLCLASGLALSYLAIPLPFNPWWNPYHDPALQGLAAGQVWLARFFWINWILFLLNLIPGLPLDGGRLFQCALWPRFGYRQAMLYTAFAGFISSMVVCVYSIIDYDDSGVVSFLLVLVMLYVACRQYILLEHGGEEPLFGYDFSQGYTSLERDPPPRPKRPNFLQRWSQRRAARRLQEEMEQREAEDRRMDQLLEKVQREGLQALTDEERRFLTRVSAKYRNRQS